MHKRLLIIVALSLWFMGCSEKSYRDMYDKKYDFFDSHPHTNAENNVKTMQNGQNPLKRPSYDEYRQP